jgi:hypothetical protein
MRAGAHLCLHVCARTVQVLATLIDRSWANVSTVSSCVVVASFAMRIVDPELNVIVFVRVTV